MYILPSLFGKLFSAFKYFYIKLMFPPQVHYMYFAAGLFFATAIGKKNDFHF